LKRVGDLLVDMHGPHDHQSLLERHFQLEVLDSFAQAPAERGAYEAAYAEMLGLQADMKALDGDDQQVAQQIDMLSYQVKEIEDANLTDADEEELGREHTRVANAQRILELTGAAHDALTESEASAFDMLVRTQSALHELAALWDEAAPWHEEARSIAVQIQELSDTVNRAAQSIDADPQRLQWLEDRMALVRKLKQKNGAAVPDVLGFLDAARKRLTDLEPRGERLAGLAAKLEKARDRVQSAGRALSARRTAAAKALAKAVTRELRDLGFAHGTFDVTLEPCPPGPSGLDAVEFGFAPNVGEPVRPLRTIASSGEISRVMLATKTVLAEHDRIPVLIFDEIDANVGGETANAVGGKLASVARSHQVLCITHLPQVAVHGTSHHVVTKSVEGGRTRTTISSLSPRERGDEIARMLGGRDLTSVTMKHAREMLRKTAPAPRK
jgi:DNA repair protein RecN (Recombination protein N)